MDKEDWNNLEHLFKLEARNKISKIGKDNLETLIQKTREVDEHPEDWDWWCECQSCQSYAD